jgi:hypothetical protein
LQEIGEQQLLPAMLCNDARFLTLSGIIMRVAHSLLPLIVFHQVLLADVIQTDLCVYGGTSGGVITAVQAARMGKTVVIVNPARHLGGMSSGGLGATDTGNIGAIGGLSREFYRRVGRHYGLSERFQFEPKVAEQVFNAMIEEHGILVRHDERPDEVLVELGIPTGYRIYQFTTDNGNVYRARMFIDASYEGDLMARAGVTYTFGRESNSLYGETLNGVRSNTPAHQFVVDIDPYHTPGDPGSGLLPYIQPGDGGVPGEGDQRIQTYNFRLCLTQTESNRIPITAPTNYDSGNYELLARYIDARVAAGHTLNLRSFCNIAAMPNGKTDINNNGAFSTDFIGQNYAYPEGDYVTREQIWNDTLNYIQGFFYFLGSDPRVPVAIRTETQSWGLCRDEFQDTAGWPHQMYVREARRMVSDYVMTEHNCRGTVRAPKSIGMASYTMDSHNVQRVVQGGFVRNEGDFQTPVPTPYPIAYDSIVPARGDCENLFVTFALSASHVAFGSVRMEPVFMITSQSAASAAALAIDDNLAVQDVPYSKLRLQLLADRQILDWGVSSATTNAIILDSEQPSGVTIVGGWATSTSNPGYWGANYLHDQNVNKGTKSVRCSVFFAQEGIYTVHLRWTSDPNRASNVPITITHAGGTTNFTVNQRANGGVWYPVGVYTFASNTTGTVLIETTGTDGFVIADAVMWLPQTVPPPPVIDLIATDTIAGEDGPDSARFILGRSGDASAALTVNYTVSGSATPGADYPQPAGSIFFAPGQIFVPLTITPESDSLFEPGDTIVFTLTTNAGYELGEYTNATAFVRDGGFGAWRGMHFDDAELADPGLSGAEADPDFDRVPNLLEFFHGLNPKLHDVAPPLQIVPPDLLWQRQTNTGSLYTRIERSMDLITWGIAPFHSQQPSIAGDTLRFPLGDLSGSHAFYRAAVSQVPIALTTENAYFFFSFDTLTNGTGPFTDMVTTNRGFYGTPKVGRAATFVAADEAGGALRFTNFAGVIWLGSGQSGTPGHSLTFNPGSVQNELSLSFSTIGLQQVRLSMQVRSAAQAGGTAPRNFTSFTYDIGASPVLIPGANLDLIADNTFREWTGDLSSITALNNRPSVTLRWTFEDLAATPQESLRVDNLQVSASPIP